LVERVAYNDVAGGSSPSAPTDLAGPAWWHALCLYLSSALRDFQPRWVPGLAAEPGKQILKTILALLSKNR
jgi:hypothetical protein